MTTCKDCLHNHVCALWRAQEGQDAKSWSDSDDWDCDYFDDKSKFVEMVERGEKMRWIPVAVKLPEEDECEYLVIVNGEHTNDEYANGPYATQRFERAVEIASYSEEEGWVLEAYPDWDDPVITHWMPLPNPPEVDHGPN